MVERVAVNPRFELRFVRKDGKIIDVETYNTEFSIGNKKLNQTTFRDITDRKKAEHKLKESEVKFRTAVENSPDFMVFIKRDGTIFDVNRLEKEFTREMVIGQSVFKEGFYETKDQCESARKAISDSLETGETTLFEYSQIAPDGSHSFYETRVSPFEYDNESKILSLQLVTRDITKRKKSEQKLKKSEKNYKDLSNELELIIDNVPGLIFYKDTKNKFIRVNKYLADAHKLSKEEMEGRSMFDLYPKKEAQAYWDDDLEVIRSGKPKLNFEEPWETPEGRRWVNTSKIPIVEENGEISGIIGFSTDITDRKLAEEKLIESEDRYRNERDNLMNILNTMEEGVVLINHQYEVEFVNPAFINEFGPYEGKKCYDYFHDREEVCTICRNEDVFKGKTVRREWHSKKTQKTYDLISTPLKNPDGSVSILDIFHDISSRKRVEQKLKDISRLKSELLRRASHELKTPLVSIKGNADLLLNLHYDRLESDTISVVQEIKEGCERLEDLIQDLLESSQLESGQVKLKPVREDLAFLIKFCVRELEGLAKIRNHKIEVEIHENLNTMFEKERLYEVINNFPTNIYSYTLFNL